MGSSGDCGACDTLVECHSLGCRHGRPQPTPTLREIMETDGKQSNPFQNIMSFGPNVLRLLTPEGLSAVIDAEIKARAVIPEANAPSVSTPLQEEFDDLARDMHEAQRRYAVAVGSLPQTATEAIMREQWEKPAYPDDNPKSVVGMTKPPLHHIPPSALLLLGQAMADGSRKYGTMNWRQTRVAATVYYDAMQRHLLAWLDGEDAAQDSGVAHLAHVMACCAILLDAAAAGRLTDDRPHKGNASALIGALTKKPA